MTKEYMQQPLPGGYDGPGEVQAIMNRGDIMFWHHWMVHGSSTNCSVKIRQAVIARFHSTKHGQAMLADDGGDLVLAFSGNRGVR